MTSPETFPIRAQEEVQRILASRMFCSGRNDIDTAEHLRYAIRHVTLQGLWLEFGVSNGASLKVIAEQTSARIYGFDSFEGLPEDWVRGEGRPTLRRDRFAAVRMQSRRTSRWSLDFSRTHFPDL